MHDAEVRDFYARVRHLGPQEVIVGDMNYRCYTPVKESGVWFIATTPHDYQLFRVNPHSNLVRPIELAHPHQGELMNPSHHIQVGTIIQKVTEAWIDHNALEHFAQYLVTVVTIGRLIHADELTEALFRLDPEASNLAQFRGDQVGSPRLTWAWIQSIMTMAHNSLEAYESAK